MPRQSRFHSLRTQHAVVAAITLSLFVASLALAVGLGRYRAATPVNRPSVPQAVHGLTLKLPAPWQRAETLDLPHGLKGHRFFDTDRPSRVLLVIRVATDQPMPGNDVMAGVLPTLWPPGLAETLATAGTRDSIRPPYTVVEWVGASTAGGDRLHMAADLTRDNRIHWLLYLTDRVQPGEEALSLLHANQGLLRGVVYLATIEPTSPAVEP